MRRQLAHRSLSSHRFMAVGRAVTAVLIALAALLGGVGFNGTVSAADPRSEAAVRQGSTYVRGELGYTLGFDSDVSGTPDSTVDFEGNWTGGAAVGRYIRPKLRTELSFGYNTNDFESASGGFGGVGDVNALSFFATVYRDFLAFRNVRPFVGFGLGLARLRPDFALTGEGTVGPDGSDIKFAWQGTTGVAVDLNERFAIETRYRYLRAGDYDFGPGAEGDYANHSLLAGLRYTFGRAGRPIERGAPPATPAQTYREPAPVVPRSAPAPEPQPALAGGPEELGLVFFPFNSSDLTAEANETLDGIAASLRIRKARAVILEGHTDTSGDRAYNLRLSRARAERVREALVERGVPSGSITIAAKGEGAPRMRTGDGVKAQLNRFVRVFAVFE
ncbi:MAG: OmpA family protein [Alphaproteobacteria bacterium]